MQREREAERKRETERKREIKGTQTFGIKHYEWRFYLFHFLPCS